VNLFSKAPFAKHGKRSYWLHCNNFVLRRAKLLSAFWNCR
jgi:hypothetical protein